jgi:hypothetical protein
MSLEAADFEIDNFMIDQLVYPENDSGVVTFFLTPKKAQKRAWVVIHVFKDEQRSQQLGSLGLNTEVKGEGELITDRSWQVQTSAKITEVSTGIKGISPLESVSFDGNLDFSVGLVVEEVSLGKEVVEKIETIKATLRRQDVEIEEIPAARSFADYDSDFHAFYTAKLANSGVSYDELKPSFNFGYTLATREPFRSSPWSAIEVDGKRIWEEKNPGTWDQSKAVIKYAWEKVRNAR